MGLRKEQIEIDKDWAKEVWEKIRNNIEIGSDRFVVHYAENLFELLVAIILSQNTNDKNSIKAFMKLKKHGLLPEKILAMDTGELEKLIRVAGLYKQKAKTIRMLAEEIMNGFDLREIVSGSVEEAKKRLMKIRGLGKKTIDVFLAINGKKIMGIDTHAKRIALRWGISKSNSYDDIQKAYMQLFGFIDDLDTFHKYLIELGRKYCRARNPKCDSCPISELCPKIGIEK
ncbi:MAG: endonuclease III [Candidatus Njordarchaeota archaeon]